MLDKPKGTVVFYLLDAVGHINPMLSLVSEMSRRGYHTLILTMRRPKSAKRLEAAGYELDYCIEPHSEISTANNAEEVARGVIEMLRKGPTVSLGATYGHEGTLGTYLEDFRNHHHLIEAKLKQLKPDVVVFDHTLGMPCITTYKWVRIYSGFPSSLYSSINENFVHGIGLRLDEMTPEWKDFEYRAKIGTMEGVRRFFAEQNVYCPIWPARDTCPTSPYLNLYFGPNELGYENEPSLKKLPDVWCKLEHTIDENLIKRSHFEIPESLENCPGKLIYFSLGTLVSCDVNLINRLLKMLSKSPNKFIVSMGAMHESVKLYPNMWGDEYIDQKAVLAVADLFITHSGHNSIIEAFYNGVPGLVTLPIFADQFDLAQRVEDCGFGIRLDPYNCTEEEMLNSIEYIISNDGLKQRMKSISARLKSIKYHEIAADKLEALACA